MTMQPKFSHTTVGPLSELSKYDFDMLDRALSAMLSRDVLTGPDWSRATHLQERLRSAHTAYLEVEG